jgi:signal transduction histidine kinase
VGILLLFAGINSARKSPAPGFTRWIIAVLLFTAATTVVAFQSASLIGNVFAMTAFIAGLGIATEVCLEFRGLRLPIVVLYLAAAGTVAAAGYFEQTSRPATRDVVLCIFAAAIGISCAVILSRNWQGQTFGSRITAILFAVVAFVAPLGVSRYTLAQNTSAVSLQQPIETEMLPLLCSMAALLVAMTERGEAALRIALIEKEREIEKSRADHASVADAAKSDLLLMIGHEVRNPLAGILATVELMLDSDLDLEQRKDALAVYTWVETLLRLTGDILDLYQIEAGKLRIHPTAFYLRDNLDGLVKTMTPVAATKGLTLDLNYQGQVPITAIGDATRIRQVIMNLVSNALKFTSSGGIHVDVAYEALDAGNGELQVSVIDTGIGISPENLATLFDRESVAHESTSRTHGGSGIGLAISWRLVKLMGGHLEAESKIGEGSTFRVRIPLQAVSRPNWAGR